MRRYMLDANISSYIMKRSNQVVLRRLQKLAVDDVCISVISKSELRYGIELSSRRKQDEAALSAFLAYVEVLDFPD
jgi:tRNA(fMet)-specific endonuclease VapC